jgi:segregation and condensation protein B
MSLKAKLEAVIYAAEEPVTLAQLAVLFAADALEFKAEQQAQKAEQEAASVSADSDQTPPTAEPLPLLAEGFEYFGLDQSPPEEAAISAESADSASPDSAQPETIGLDAEPDSTRPADPETAQNLEPDEDEPADLDFAEPPAGSEQEAKRQARLRDREARAIIRALLDELIADYASDARGVEIREIAGGFRMATKPECHDAVRSFVKSLKPALKLSLPALETLAVIAYKQPVTAPEVNEIRGVDSSGVFGSLLARKLIATAGRKPVIGRPILYKTTREFLLRFGLKDVSELPSMEEFEKMASLELDEPEPSSSTEPATAVTLDLELDETDDEVAGQASSPGTSTEEEPAGQAASLGTSTEEELVGQGFSPDANAGESSRALAPEVSSSNDPAEIQQDPATPQTAETADSINPLSTEEAAPAAPPATEQAETENLPHGEEVHEEI